ncbi:TetR family transcriptional regulator [Rhodococcus sp. CX]|uniref:TetR/AcrR family transcriptional regulator n=1 Tax=Rhodococcus sp. CX TaxID=2789880 RepID=UPI0018CEF640|nr:TetR family transcriptional regulator [Rhodococcus sp. CX]MBH0123569.1 TetR family transcriptional regulator [Rhodococcus sp. CX]
MTQRPTSKSVDARNRIIRVAERLFAERGIARVSLREISATAGYANNNAVQYHFGSKDALVKTVFQYRYLWLDEQRIKLLAELPSDPTIEEAVQTAARCLVLPLVSLLDDPEGSYHLRFAAQLYQQPEHNVLTTTGDLHRELFGNSDSVIRSVYRMVDDHFTGTDRHRLFLRERFVAALVTNAMAAREAAEEKSSDTLQPSRALFVDQLLLSVRLLLRGEV